MNESASHNKTKTQHVCLAGYKVTEDWDLIRQLRTTHHVTLIRREHLTLDKTLLESVQGMIVDCTDSKNVDSQLFRCLRQWKKQFPALSIVLVDGGLSQQQIATAFRQGARDYFAYPYDVGLLVDRVKFLMEHQKA